MNQAAAFRLLMEARQSNKRVLEAASHWRIAPNEVRHLSRSALRVAESLDLPRTILANRLVRIDFDDKSSCITDCIGSRFY